MIEQEEHKKPKNNQVQFKQAHTFSNQNHTIKTFTRTRATLHDSNNQVQPQIREPLTKHSQTQLWVLTYTYSHWYEHRDFSR